MGLLRFAIGGIRKAALGKAPVGLCNRRGFSAEKRIPPSPPQKNGNFDRIAVLFFLCYDERREGTGGMSALLDDDR